MTLNYSHNAGSLALCLGLLSFGPGLWSLGHAPLSNLGGDVGDGVAQRHYEARFQQAFPMAQEVRDLWAALRLGLLGEASDGVVLGRDGILFTAEEFKEPAEAPAFGETLQMVRDRLRSHGSELVPVFVPDKARMLAWALPVERSSQYQKRYDTLLASSRDLGLRSVDLRPVLANPQGSLKTYMRTDTHWSPEGARLAAQHIAAILHPDLGTPTHIQTLYKGHRSYEGDLLAFVETGRWQSLVGPTTETIATYETVISGEEVVGAGDLFADHTLDVALVGTSFSEREQFHFIGFLSSALGTEVASYAEAGRGPVQPMLAYLDSAAPQETPARIVLWEVPERYINTWRELK